MAKLFLIPILILCPHSRGGGAIRFALVHLSVCPNFFYFVMKVEKCGHPCTIDTFLVINKLKLIPIVNYYYH